MIMQRLSLLAREHGYTQNSSRWRTVYPLARGTPSLPLRIFEGFRFIPLARGTRGADYDFPIIYRFISLAREHLSG
ncbi:hypothetical protein JT306_23435 [Salmonella enterica subsp. enterica serovar Kentucky]|nr:hypothetical protein [Salmonella enterica subsp. enterica serovar Kentucky]